MIARPLYLIETARDFQVKMASYSYDACDAANRSGPVDRPKADCQAEWRAAYDAYRCSGEECAPFRSAFFALAIYAVAASVVVGVVGWIINGFRRRP